MGILTVAVLLLSCLVFVVSTSPGSSCIYLVGSDGGHRTENGGNLGAWAYISPIPPFHPKITPTVSCDMRPMSVLAGSPAYHYSRHAAAAAERGVAGRPDVLASPNIAPDTWLDMPSLKPPPVLSATCSCEVTLKQVLSIPTNIPCFMSQPILSANSPWPRMPCNPRYTHAPTTRKKPAYPR
ncbi:hypothetical protein B0I37DRAFT_82945 [Chaetomium sp. MPI-CAGE-AT-0009]|nr:hypothetical protein B0I37DRAFT_82945 [Chaetomium sp. MPI-CAGE-AT-0009]